MEKVYRLGDISENKTDFERTTFIVKNEKNGKRIFCYTEKNGRLSNLKKCDSLYDDSSLFEFFKSIKENFLINDELSIYTEKQKGIFKTTEEECLNSSKPINIINKSKDISIIFMDKNDLKDWFFNLEKKLKRNIYVKRP